MRHKVETSWNTNQPKEYYDEIVHWFSKINNLSHLSACGLIVDNKEFLDILYDVNNVEKEPIETGGLLTEYLGRLKYSTGIGIDLSHADVYDNVIGLMDFRIKNPKTKDKVLDELVYRLYHLYPNDDTDETLVFDGLYPTEQDHDLSMLNNLLKAIEDSNAGRVKAYRNQLKIYIENLNKTR